MADPVGIIIGWGEIIVVAGAIMTPLLGTIKILYDGKESERKRADLKDETWIKEYNSMRDRMQDKIDAANAKAGDAISTVTAAIAGFTQALQNIDKERSEDFDRLVDKIVASVKEAVK